MLSIAHINDLLLDGIDLGQGVISDIDISGATGDGSCQALGPGRR